MEESEYEIFLTYWESKEEDLTEEELEDECKLNSFESEFC